MATSKKTLPFDLEDFIVYPKHGVGRIVEMETQEVAGTKLELYVIRFEKERMTLRVPVNKAQTSGMRKLSSDVTLKRAFTTLKGRARVKRTMWSRRAQEYEAKINSGCLVSIAEVVRDLHRAEDQPEQSYSERQIYESALGRLARELAAVEEIDEAAAILRLEKELRPFIPIKSAEELAAEAALAEGVVAEEGVVVEEVVADAVVVEEAVTEDVAAA